MIQEVHVKVNAMDATYQTDTNMGDILKDVSLKGKTSDYSFIINKKQVDKPVTAKTTLQELGVFDTCDILIELKSSIQQQTGQQFNTQQAQQQQQNYPQPPNQQYQTQQPQQANVGQFPSNPQFSNPLPQNYPNPPQQSQQPPQPQPQTQQANAGQFPLIQQINNPLTQNQPNPPQQSQSQPQPQQANNRQFPQNPLLSNPQTINNPLLQQQQQQQQSKPVQFGQVPVANQVFVVQKNILNNKIKAGNRQPIGRAPDQMKVVKDFTIKIFEDGSAVELSKGNDKEFTAIFYEENATEEATNSINLSPSDMNNNEAEVVRCNGTKVMFLTGYRGIVIKWYSNLITQFEFWFNE